MMIGERAKRTRVVIPQNYWDVEQFAANDAVRALHQAGQLNPRTLYSRIAGTGSFVPEKRLTNADLEHTVETSDEWIRSRTGIEERRVADGETAASDLACEACLRALKQAGMDPADIDLIVAATVTPDTLMPSTACWLQGRLGAQRAAAFDLNAACSGFIYALSVADNMIRCGSAYTALVVGTDTFSKIVDYADRTTCILFGDGAGAVVLEATCGESHLLSTHLGSDGRLAHLLEIPAGGSRLPATHETVEQKLHTVKMRNGKDIFRQAVNRIAESVAESLERLGFTTSDVALLVPHQANIRILNAVTERLGLPPEKVFTNLDHYGNTSAASIPLALDEAVRTGRVNRGDIVVLTAFGAGLTWGTIVMRW